MARAERANLFDLFRQHVEIDGERRRGRVLAQAMHPVRGQRPDMAEMFEAVRASSISSSRVSIRSSLSFAAANSSAMVKRSKSLESHH